MKYALGNMLNGAGGLSSDGLAIDLQFAADKTLTARKGPTPVFTRASTATFVGSNGLIQSSAINAARFDHDPVTLTCRGLLIEEARTNLHLRSDDLSVSPWTRTGSNITVNSGVSPDGLTTADLIYEDTAISSHSISAFIGGTTVGATYTHSIYLKAAGRNIVALGDWGGLLSEFNLSTGQVIAGGNGLPQIQNVGNGWYRCSVTGASTAIGVTPGFRLRSVSGINSYLGDGVSGVLAWGAQFEAGAFPTSYITTTTASVVRSADVCSITGSAFTGFYNQAEGTVLIGHPFRNNSLARSFYIGDGTNSTNTLELFSGSPGIGSNAFSGGAQQYGQFVFAANNSMAKASLAVAPSNAMLAVNGTLAASGGGLMPVGPNQLIIGNRPDGGRNINGHIPFFRYYRKRLANAKLQAITT